jgi:hypothetical protein
VKALALVVALAAPPAPAPAPSAPPAATAPLPLLPPPIPSPGPPPDAELIAPPPPPRTGARLVIAAGAAMMVAGLLGMLVTPGCATRDHRGRCVDRPGSDDIYPALIVLGLGTTATGSYWYRHDLPPPPVEGE